MASHKAKSLAANAHCGALPNITCMYVASRLKTESSGRAPSVTLPLL